MRKNIESDSRNHGRSSQCDHYVSKNNDKYARHDEEACWYFCNSVTLDVGMLMDGKEYVGWCCRDTCTISWICIIIINKQNKSIKINKIKNENKFELYKIITM